ncbi:hypothetical protein AB835_12710 [Candidatus Endobugula sertula]|uniref:Uncharacterized protein n=1 Tax=Candidatus Endobugula sertula TaxID=62101 RepID=A0A1D2QMA7_9GAMM|nr:hypothetical protein AB835_12710 [Candidatus Endobugula sertula]
MTAVEGKPGLYQIDSATEVTTAGRTADIPSHFKPTHAVKVGDEYFAVKYKADRREIGLFDPTVSSGGNSKVLFSFDAVKGKWTSSKLRGGDGYGATSVVVGNRTYKVRFRGKKGSSVSEEVELLPQEPGTPALRTTRTVYDWIKRHPGKVGTVVAGVGVAAVVLGPTLGITLTKKTSDNSSNRRPYS